MPAPAKRSSVTTGSESRVKNVANVVQRKSSCYRVTVSRFVISADDELTMSSNVG